MFRLWLLAAGALATGPCLASDSEAFGTESPIICSVVQVNECARGSACVAVRPEEINAPDFLRINLRQGTITADRADGIRMTEIEFRETLGDLVVLQGAEPQSSLPEAALAWTLGINRRTGRMTMTALSPGVSFVIFGACTTP